MSSLFKRISPEVRINGQISRRYCIKIATVMSAALLCLPLCAGELSCAVCGKSIVSGRYYRTKDQRAICSRQCLDSLRPVCSVCRKRCPGDFLTDARQRIYCSEKCFNNTLPVCSVCGKRARSGYRQDQSGRIFCSEQCASTTFPVCRSCGKPAAAGAERADGIFLCQKCLSLPQCASCKNPLNTQFYALADGRKLCTDCHRHGIFSQEKAQQEFESVRKQLKEELSLYVPGEIIFRLVDLNTLKEISASRDGEGELGVCNHRVTAITRGKKELRREYRREISILFGLQPAQFRAVAAHELAHDWFNMNVAGRLSPEITEGWAELVSWYYCRARGCTRQQKLIETNGEVTYRRGFELMKSRLSLPENPQKIRLFFQKMNPEPLI